jgi:hypothetical protein
MSDSRIVNSNLQPNRANDASKELFGASKNQFIFVFHFQSSHKIFSV